MQKQTFEKEKKKKMVTVRTVIPFYKNFKCSIYRNMMTCVSSGNNTLLTLLR